MIDSATLTGLLSVAPSTDIEEVLIPIVAIVGGLTIPILALTFAHRKQQMQARIIERAIEQGLTVEEIDELLSRQGFGEENEKKAKQSRAVPFRAGLVVFAIGAAFFLAENPHIVGAHGGWMPEGFFGRGRQLCRLHPDGHRRRADRERLIGDLLCTGQRQGIVGNPYLASLSRLSASSGPMAFSRIQQIFPLSRCCLS